jgi:predicted short-subunit dehydrogenase-like oxidoreductase (DUF2520 family)
MTVPDSAVAALAGQLARMPPRPGTEFAHVSGALGLDALDAVTRAGFAAGSMHPLQTFPVPRPKEAFHGVVFAVEATDARLRTELEVLARRLGGKPRHVRDADRPLYHAAAVLAGNDVVALAAVAVSVLGAAGWAPEDALSGLLPLMRGSVDSLAERGLPGALTGPVQRGDVPTVRANRTALTSRGLGDAVDAYDVLGRSALALARRRGLDRRAAGELEALFAKMS